MKVRYFCIFIFIVLLPFYENPTWCIRKLERNNHWGFLIDCHDDTYPYSRQPKINAIYLGLADIACVLYFFYVRKYKRRF